jgi:hypothetical protein
MNSRSPVPRKGFWLRATGLFTTADERMYYAKKYKIDHGPNASKDLTDALTGAVYHCSLAKLPGTAEAMMASMSIVDKKEDIWEKLARDQCITEQEFDKI